MHVARLRMVVAAGCALLATGCSPPPGIHRGTAIEQKIDLACVERGLKNVSASSGLSFGPKDGDKDWVSTTYRADGLTDVLDANYASFNVTQADAKGISHIYHAFDRLSDHGVSREQVQAAVDIMKRVEDGVGAACGIDLVKAMHMDCGPSLNKCEGIV